MDDRKIRRLLAFLSTITLLGSLLVINVSFIYAQQVSARPHNTVTTILPTIPSNGDLNPYGVYRVARSVGHLKRGNIFVSNFNNGTNMQGTGTGGDVTSIV